MEGERGASVAVQPEQLTGAKREIDAMTIALCGDGDDEVTLAEREPFLGEGLFGLPPEEIVMASPVHAVNARPLPEARAAKALKCLSENVIHLDLMRAQAQRGEIERLFAPLPDVGLASGFLQILPRRANSADVGTWISRRTSFQMEKDVRARSF